MKKTIVIASALMLTLASCGNKTAEAPEAVDSTLTEIVEDAVTSPEAAAVVDALADAQNAEDVKGVMSQAKAKYQELVESGKLDQAKEYIKSVQEYIKENAESIKEKVGNDPKVSQLIDAIKVLPTDADISAETALAAIKAASSGKAEDVLNAMKTAAANGDIEKLAEKAKEADPEKVKEAMDKAKSALDNAPDDVKKKAEEVKEAAKSAAKDKASEAVSKGLDKILGK